MCYQHGRGTGFYVHLLPHLPCRAHRIGQTNCVNVQLLLVKDSIDEVMWELLQSKLATTGQVLDGQKDRMEVRTAIIHWCGCPVFLADSARAIVGPVMAGYLHAGSLLPCTGYNQSPDLIAHSFNAG